MQTALKITGISLAALVLLGGAMFAAAEALEETDTHRETIPGKVDHVVIEAESGDIEVVPGGRSVQVERTDRYAGESPDVSQTVEDGVLTLDAECDGVFSVFCTVDYRVEVPEGVTVDARTYVGDVDVRVAHKANVTARTHVGDIDVELPRGRYDVETDTAVGDADVEGVVDADKSRHIVEARADVGSVDVTAR
jgi:hypothetical protein